MNGKLQEAVAAQKWMEWSANPCGRKPLDFAALPRFEKRQEGHSKGVDFKDPMHREEALRSLNSAICRDVHFPEKILGVFDGLNPHDPSYHMIEIYGEGSPPQALPEPLKPSFMK